jgi:hypothetical protein
MELMVTELPKKVPKVFECKTCDYSTSRLGQYKRHLATDKHKWYQNGNEKVPAKNECGNCGRCYAHLSALSRHRKTCIQEVDQTVVIQNTISLIPQDTILEIMKELVVSQNQNNDLQQKILEQQSKIIELTHAKTVNNTNTNCNNNNKIININMFLNEQCKDAITIQEFLKSIKPTVEDVMYLTEHGNKEGISKIITNALGQLEVTERPLHCTDLKRHTTYVKHPEGWNKEQDQIHTKKIYDHTVHKCSTQLNTIFDSDPKYYERGTDEYENRIKMMTETFSDKNRDAILRNVEVSIQLDKNLIE